MNKKLGIIVLSGLIALPVVAFAYTDCRDIDKPDACSIEQLVQISSQTFLSMEDRIAALKMAVSLLTNKLAILKDPTMEPGHDGPPMCLTLNNNLIIGSTDRNTNGEVSKLQLWLKGNGYFPDAQGTGYYGEKTAAAVMKWQKAHGMDFVTIKSGVGQMTRGKMKCTDVSSLPITKIQWRVELANPTITDVNDYRKYEQVIFVDIIRSDNSIRGYSAGKAYGCAASNNLPVLPGKKVLGFVNCYMALTSTYFTAYETNGKFIVERGDESAKDGSVKKTVVLEI